MQIELYKRKNYGMKPFDSNAYVRKRPFIENMPVYIKLFFAPHTTHTIHARIIIIKIEEVTLSLN
jgi:hypothetical protein